MKGIFSARELSIIKIVTRKRMTFEEIAGELENKYHFEMPFDYQITVANSVRRINDKCRYHKLDWKLTKEKVRGKINSKLKLGVKKEKL